MATTCEQYLQLSHFLITSLASSLLILAEARSSSRRVCREAVTLPAECELTMLKPMPRFPMRQSAPLQRDALPHDLLLVDIKDAALVLGEGPSPQDRQLFCSLRLLHSGAGSKPAVRTRALAADASGAVAWAERMVLSLPLTADAQSLGVEVWDAAANGGRGSLVASGSIAVPVKDLLNREEHAADVELKSSSGEPAAQLHATYMLQNQWRKLASTPVDSWSAEQSTSGQRALSISTNPGVWVVIPPFGQQKAASSAAARNAGAGGCTLRMLVMESRDRA